jgi:adenylate cyclase
MNGQSIFEFDLFRLDPEQRRLSYAGSPVALSPKTLDTLIVLVRNAGSLLRKDFLHQHLWADAFVEDVTLARSISDLRAALNRYSATQYIETVSKYGYRFVAEVRSAPAAYCDATTNPASPSCEPTVAVLPFDVLGDDESLQVFGDGLAEEIIHFLSRITGLRVAARGSSFQFRNSAPDLRNIAARLGAAFVLHGSIRKSGHRLRVTAQLVEMNSFSVLWSEHIEREPGDFLEIQESMAQAIGRELCPRLGLPATALASSPRLPLMGAWHSCWEGRFHQHRFTPEGIARAEQCFERAILADPGYALPHVSLAENQHIKANLALACPNEVLPKAHEAISKALFLESASAEAHAAAGVNAVFWRYHWAEAESHFHRALALCPSSSSVRHLYSLWWLRPQGRLKEAIDENRIALDLDPLSPFLRIVQAYLHYLAGNETEAIALCNVALAFEDRNYLAHRIMGHIFLRQREKEKAHAAYVKAEIMSGNSIVDSGYVAATEALLGDKAKASRMSDNLRNARHDGYFPPTSVALLEASLGRTEEACRWLQIALEEHDPNVLTIGTDPIWNSLKHSNEYRYLIERIGL